MDIREKVMECMEYTGIVIDSLDSDDIDMYEFGIDSLTFVSLIVTIEEELDIEIPDNFLQPKLLQSLNGFMSMVEQLFEHQHQ
ncbi:MAG: acyl carrier protein [Epulopiscium sp.]|nr:acyl carrier protein [Candidatus Epulonipiscium sp.]